MAKKKEEKEVKIAIPAIRVEVIKIRLVGDSPLISNRWSEKAKTAMLDKQMKRPTQGKQAKDPDKDFQESLYLHPDGGYGFPALAFKCAAVSACRYTNMAMTVAKGAFHVIGQWVKIEGEPTMREDMVRLSGPGNVADIRYRGEFLTWSTEVTVRYNADAITPPLLANLFNLAGFGVGVGEWRPERNGNFGMFHVGLERE